MPLLTRSTPRRAASFDIVEDGHHLGADDQQKDEEPDQDR